MYDDETQEAIWPALAINYTAKTQYFYRISKGALNPNDDAGVNQKKLNRRVPYENMIYFGDGMTDIPAMILTKNNGGTSIAVYQEGQKHKVTNLYEDGRVNFVSLANYHRSADLENVVRLVMQRLALNLKLQAKETDLYDK